jgi:hypothetical protein
MLPIDWEKTVSKVQEGGQSEEHMRYSVFRRDPESGLITGTLGETLEEFRDQFKKDPHFVNLVSVIDEFTESIFKEIEEVEQEIGFLVFFCSLPRVRRLDPISIRKGAKLHQDLITQAEKYSVIAETVLGAAFVGFGNRLAFHASSEKGHELSQFQCLSFVCQGAIPSDQTLSLWDTYTRWKDSILQNGEKGFPLGYKLRPLIDVLFESRVPFSHSLINSSEREN